MAVKPQQMRDAARQLSPFIGEVPLVLTIAAGVRCADLGRLARRLPADRAGDAQHAGADRRRHQRFVCDAGRRAAAAAPAVAGARGRAARWSGATRGRSRRGHRRFGQRPGLRVLFPRSARAGGAGARARARRMRAGSPMRRSRAASRSRSRARTRRRRCARKSRRKAAPPRARSTCSNAAQRERRTSSPPSRRPPRAPASSATKSRD